MAGVGFCITMCKTGSRRPNLPMRNPPLTARVCLPILFAGVAMRALVPAGYMPAAPGSGLLFELCHDGMPPAMMAALKGGGHAHGHHAAHAAGHAAHAAGHHGSHHDDAVNHGGHGDNLHAGHHDSSGNHGGHGHGPHTGHDDSHGSHNDHGNSPHAGHHGHHGAGSHDGHGHCSIGHLLSMVFLDTDSTTDFTERSIADFYVTEPVDRLFVIRRYAQAPRGPPLA